MCNVHPWMRAFVFVFETRITQSPRRREIQNGNLPPGTYTIEAWQEKYGTQDQTLTIGPHESKSDFVPVQVLSVIPADSISGAMTVK